MERQSLKVIEFVYRSVASRIRTSIAAQKSKVLEADLVREQKEKISLDFPQVDSSSVSSKSAEIKGVYQAIWKEMQDYNIKENNYTALSVDYHSNVPLYST